MPKDATKKEEKPSKKVVVVEEISDDSNLKDADVSEQEDHSKEAETKTVVKDTSDRDSNTDISEVLETKNEEMNLGKLMWIIIPTTLLVGALAGGIITYFSGISSIQPESSPTPSSTVAPEANMEQAEENTDGTESKREELKIQVLNGSGVAGAAGKAADFLEGLGYKDIDVGNADKSSYQETVLSIKEEKNNYKELLVKDLEEEYELSDEIETLESTSSYDVVITLGS